MAGLSIEVGGTVAGEGKDLIQALVLGLNPHLLVHVHLRDLDLLLPQVALSPGLHLKND